MQKEVGGKACYFCRFRVGIGDTYEQRPTMLSGTIDIHDDAIFAVAC